MCPLGRLHIDGLDAGAGAAIHRDTIVTAYHVVEGAGEKPIDFVTADGERCGVRLTEPRMRVLPELDAAVLFLGQDLSRWLPTRNVAQGERWRVETPPPGNDPVLSGEVTMADGPLVNARGNPVRVIQLTVDQVLGDYKGYSGSAVLDALGLAITGVLVEQKGLRARMQQPLARLASNVLYALPISDVLSALDIDVMPARPRRFNATPVRHDVLRRSDLIDRLVSGLTTGDGPWLVRVSGPGGMGKSILLDQVLWDTRVWSAYPGGVIELQASERSGAIDLLDALGRAVGSTRTDLLEALAGESCLIAVDDVWDADLVSQLVASLPATASLVVTTRGLTLPDTALGGRRQLAIPVGSMSVEETRELLARGVDLTDDLVAVLDDLGTRLGHWPLLLSLAASEIHEDGTAGDELGDLQPQLADVKANAVRLSAAFERNPTLLDEPDSQQRSFDRMLRRSLDRLGDRASEFGELTVFPPGARIASDVLADLWGLPELQAQRMMKGFGRVGLATVHGTKPLTISLHPLISAWLHQHHGGPEDPVNTERHRRLLRRMIDATGDPVDLSGTGLSWIAYHACRAGDDDVPAHLLRPAWRQAFAAASGTDSPYLSALRTVAEHFAARSAEVRLISAALLHAAVSAGAQEEPSEVLVARAVLSNPEAALLQAAAHPKPTEAANAIASIVEADIPDPTPGVLDLALNLVRGLREPGSAATGLARLAQVVSVRDPQQASILLEEGLSIAAPMAEGEPRARSHMDLAAGAARLDLERGIEFARGIADGYYRSLALIAVAEHVVADRPDLARTLLNEARSVAENLSEALRWWPIREIPPVLAKIDAASALELSAELPYDWDQRVSRLEVARAIADTDPAWASEIIAEERSQGRPSSGADHVVGALATALARTDLHGALAEAMSAPVSKPRDRALGEIAQAWAATDAEAAVSIATAAVDARLEKIALAGVARVVHTTDPCRAAQILALIPAAGALRNDERTTKAMCCLADVVMRTDEESALRLLAASEVLVSPDISAFENADSRGAIAAVLSRARPAKALRMIKAVTHPFQQCSVIEACADTLAATARDGAIDAAEGIADAWHRAQALQALTKAVAAIDAPGALSLARQVPASHRAVALGCVAAATMSTNREEALEILDEARSALNGIGNETAADESAAQIGLMLAEHDINIGLDLVRSTSHTSVKGHGLAALAGIAALTDLSLAESISAELEYDHFTAEALARIGRAMARTSSERNKIESVLVASQDALAASFASSSERSAVMVIVAEALALIDAPESAEYAMAIPDNRYRAKALGELAWLRAHTDLPDAAALIERVPDDFYRQEERRRLARRLTASNWAGETALPGFRIGTEGDAGALWDAITVNWYSLSSILDLYSGYIAAVPTVRLKDGAYTRALVDVIDRFASK